MNEHQMNELLLQSLEHEKGGVQVYEMALKCAINDDLRKEWNKYLEQTRHHVEVLTDICQNIGLDEKQFSPTRTVVQKLGRSLVAAMSETLNAGAAEAAQIMACECVVLAETKDHLDWELIGKCAQMVGGDKAKALKRAYKEIEEQEDEHLYHSKGWCRELWFESLGIEAMLPPPEERKHVKSATEAARAEKASERGRFA